MKQEFHFEFESESGESALTYESSTDGSDRVTTSINNGVLTVCGNPGGFLVLARILIQMALGGYQNGFHVHLQKDYDPDAPDCLTVMLDQTERIVGPQSGSS